MRSPSPNVITTLNKVIVLYCFLWTRAVNVTADFEPTKGLRNGENCTNSTAALKVARFTLAVGVGQSCLFRINSVRFSVNK